MALTACNNSKAPVQEAQEPEAATMQTTSNDIITKEGLGEFKIGATIPDSHPDYDIKEVVSVDEMEFEEVSYEFSKNGEVLFVVYPAYIEETDAQSDKIGGIMVMTDQFTHNGIGVGSNVNDILKANPDLKVTFYDDQLFRIIDNDGIVYLVNAEGYDGPLPEVPFDYPAPVESPTFKPDAKVSAIWI